ncbi:MAG TPA: diacylglycerol kinase family protein [Candidatus Limnocylindria bacterium]|nr:diacylglycerol kinase family protein [Candidatus Limnocylindria bacterium]
MGVTRRPLLLLVNPSAGGKPAAPGAELERPDPAALRDGLRDSGLAVELRVLAEDDDPGALAATAAAQGRDVVVAGGDGTVRPVATALVAGEATLGVVPLGSWNNIARGVGVPLDPAAALAVIGSGSTRRVDVGLAWHPAADALDPAAPPPDATAFFEAAGIGLDAAGFGAAKAGDRHGAWVAVRRAWRALRVRRTSLRLTVDGRRLRTAAPAVTVCNGPYHGLGFALAPDADPADGLLDLVVFSGMGRLDVIRLFLAVARGRPRREPRVRYLTAREIRVEGRRPLPVHADGEPLGTTPVALAVRPAALAVFAPRDAPG